MGTNSGEGREARADSGSLGHGDPSEASRRGKSGHFTHLDSSGAARMVDVAEKPITARTAEASGRVLVSEQVVSLLRGAGVPKGDALAVARIAGIQGAKRTSDLIPLCHPIGIASVSIDLDVVDGAVEIRARVKTADRTGVEMEALTAVTIAGLTLIDMVKAVDPAAILSDVRVESKSGGLSGDWTR
ncbi:cyclic pyranopterin monophosphate synthase MoaC [Actinocrinis sp.]|uniref:cyclic pyranopterin monophosphate synthase MoaC n=1 Tax=Actinocrinis sp. TaxID=1920516 RepID=UPI0039C89D25